VWQSENPEIRLIFQSFEDDFLTYEGRSFLTLVPLGPYPIRLDRAKPNQPEIREIPETWMFDTLDFNST
jgi:hypothetical protein